MKYEIIHPISDETFEAKNETGKSILLDKVEFAITPKENVHREILAKLDKIIGKTKNIHEEGLLTYVDCVKLNDALYLVRDFSVKELLPFEPKDSGDTVRALLMVLRILQAFHHQDLIVGGLSMGELKRAPTGEVILQEPHILNYLSTWLADESYKIENGPEIIRGNSWGRESDIFAWGLLAYRLFTGQSPYTAKDPSDHIAQILRGKIAAPRDFQPKMSDELSQLILKALDNEPSKRPDVSDLIVKLSELFEKKTYEVSPGQAEEYQVVAESRRKKQQSRDKRWLWFRKYGTVTLSVIAAVIIGYIMMVSFRAKPVLTQKTTPMQVVNYYFKGVRKINVALVSETLHHTKNSLEDVVVNVHVANVQKATEVSPAGNLRIMINDLKIAKLFAAKDEVKYKIQYSFRINTPQQNQYMEREDLFTLKPVHKIWKITDIKILKIKRRQIPATEDGRMLQKKSVSTVNSAPDGGI